MNKIQNKTTNLRFFSNTAGTGSKPFVFVFAFVAGDEQSGQGKPVCDHQCLQDPEGQLCLLLQ